MAQFHLSQKPAAFLVILSAIFIPDFAQAQQRISAVEVYVRSGLSLYYDPGDPIYYAYTGIGPPGSGVSATLYLGVRGSPPAPGTAFWLIGPLSEEESIKNIVENQPATFVVVSGESFRREMSDGVVYDFSPTEKTGNGYNVSTSSTGRFVLPFGAVVNSPGNTLAHAAFFSSQSTPVFLVEEPSSVASITVELPPPSESESFALESPDDTPLAVGTDEVEFDDLTDPFADDSFDDQWSQPFDDMMDSWRLPGGSGGPEPSFVYTFPVHNSGLATISFASLFGGANTKETVGLSIRSQLWTMRAGFRLVLLMILYLRLFQNVRKSFMYG